MLEVIDFMERMGGDAQLSQASSSELAVALAESGISTELRSAMLAQDAQQVEELLGMKPVCMLVAPPHPPGSPYHAPISVPPPPLPEEEWEQYQREF
jgi:hypothetical protein